MCAVCGVTTSGQVASILQTCARLGLDNVTAFVADGRKAVAGEGVPPGE